jgi:hypothetical protein
MIIETDGKFPKFSANTTYNKSKDGKYIITKTIIEVVDIKSINYHKKIVENNETDEVTINEVEI